MERDRIITHEKNEKKLEFLRAAIKDGAHEKIPSGRIRNRWIGLRNIGTVYEGSSVTYEELGEMYGLSRQSIKRKRDQFLRALYLNCSPAIQEQYTLREIMVKKPTETSFKGLRYKEGLRYKIDQEEDNKTLQEILDNLPVGSVSGYLKPKRRPPIFLLLGTIMRQGGYHFRNLAAFADTLRSAGLPIRKIETGQVTGQGERKYAQSYWVVLAKRKKEILKAVEDDPKLQPLKENPVELVSGVYQERIPTTYKLRSGGDYEGVWGFIFNITGGIGVEDISSVLRNCPVPVFKVFGTYLFPAERKLELKAFLEEKYRKAH